jgi:GMP synthase-like glutamine amidotransferase
MESRQVHIAVLDTDTPCHRVYAKRGLYSSQFRSLLASAARRINISEHKPRSGSLSVHVTAFDVVGDSLPPFEALRASPWSPNEKQSPGFPGPIDAILVTGAAAAVYDDLHWIPGLRTFLQRVYADHSLVKIFGSCFGHQLIGEALLASDKVYTSKGSSFKVSVGLSSHGHEIGIHPIALNPEFVSNFPPLARFSQQPFRMQLIHGDAVISSPESPADTKALLPEPWLNLGSSLKCPIQGLYQPGRVLTFQGHFEFDAFATAELCYQFADQFTWSPAVLASHLENIMRSTVPGKEDDDDSKAAAEAVLLFFAGEDQSQDSEMHIFQ